MPFRACAYFVDIDSTGSYQVSLLHDLPPCYSGDHTDSSCLCVPAEHALNPDPTE